MLAAERRTGILEKLEREGRVLVSELSPVYGVSEETIRRDLEKLESEGYARRCYGGASYTGERELPYSLRKQRNVPGKKRIAAAAAALIPDGASVALDGSSTAAFVLRELRVKKNLTLLTNSVEIALSLPDAAGWTVLLAGGAFKKEGLSVTGSRAEEFIGGYHTDWAVISCAGLDIGAGASDLQEDDARVKRAMLRGAERVMLAADSQKFERRAFAAIAPLEELDILVTDREPDSRWEAAAREARLEWVC